MSDAIAAIWHSSADPAKWPDAMRAARRMMPECIGFLTLTPFAEGRGALWHPQDPPPGFMEEYLAKWHRNDVTIHAIARRLPIERLIIDHYDLAPEHQITRCEMWQKLYVANGIDDLSAAIVNGTTAGGAEALFFGGFCEKRKEEQSRKHKSILTMLLPHLHGAAALHWRITHTETKSATTKSILDRLALGIITLDATGHVLDANKSAKRLLDKKAGLRYERRRLWATDASAHKALEHAIGLVAKGGAERPIYVPRESGAPLMVIVAPAQIDENQNLGSSARAVLFISDPKSVPSNAGQRVAAMYGLTPTEAEISQAIAEGKDVHDIARARGASVHTVRTQLKNLMHKLGATRQSDIIRSLLAVPVLG